MQGGRGETHVVPTKATDNPGEIGPVDIVLFCVKLWDVESAGERIKPLMEGNRVEFVGEVGGKAKEEFLANAAALIFPIDWPEPFGLVMIEAMACGTPTVAYRRGSVPGTSSPRASWSGAPGVPPRRPAAAPQRRSAAARGRLTGFSASRAALLSRRADVPALSLFPSAAVCAHFSKTSVRCFLNGHRRRTSVRAPPRPARVYVVYSQTLKRCARGMPPPRAV